MQSMLTLVGFVPHMMVYTDIYGQIMSDNDILVCTRPNLPKSVQQLTNQDVANHSQAGFTLPVKVHHVLAKSMQT